MNKMINFDKQMKLNEAESVLRDGYEWDKWIKEIPFIDLPDGYCFQPIPPFSGVIARFRAKKRGNPDSTSISVYLDCYDVLGFMMKPYWELYPSVNTDWDTERFLMGDEENLVKAIVKTLEAEDD